MFEIGIVLIAIGVLVLTVTQICLHVWLKKYKETWEGYYDM